MSLGQVGNMQKSNVLVVGVVVIVAILAFVFLRGRGEEIVQKVDDFEPPTIYNTDPTPSPFQVESTGFVPTPTPSPTGQTPLGKIPSPSPTTISGFKGGISPSPSPVSTHAPVDTAVGDINPSILVAVTGSFSYIAFKISNILRTRKAS